MTFVAIVLTFNESLHLARCLASLKSVAAGILLGDCFSVDDKLEAARAHGARVVQHEWVNYAMQFNWALTQLDPDTD